MKIVLMIAQTVDGIIGRDSNHLVDWSSKADKQSFVSETKKHGVVIMGRTTYDTIGRPLPDRLNLILTSTPEKYRQAEIPDLLEYRSGSPPEIVQYLESQGKDSAVLAGGARTNAQFLSAGLVDELLISIEPLLFGQGLTFAQGQDQDIALELIESKQLDKKCYATTL